MDELGREKNIYILQTTLPSLAQNPRSQEKFFEIIPPCWARFFHDSISSTTNDYKTGFKRLASFDSPPFKDPPEPYTLRYI